MQNKGLVHLAKNIFDYLNYIEIVKFVLVSKTCHDFVVHEYGWKRMTKELDSVLKRKDYKCKCKACDFCLTPVYSTLRQCYPVWTPICEYFKSQKSFCKLTQLVTKLDEYGLLRRKLDPRWQKYNVLQMMVKLGDHRFVQLIVECRIVDFTGTFINLCKESDVFEILNDSTLRNQCKVIDVLLSNAKSAGIDINAINTFDSTQPLMHEIVVNGRPEILKYLIDNSAKYNIILNRKYFDGKDKFGRNPFEALINSNSSAMYQKLNCWLNYPDLFNADIFKKMSRNCLLTIITHICNEKPYLKSFMEEKSKLEERVWNFYKAKVASVKALKTNNNNTDEPPFKRNKIEK